MKYGLITIFMVLIVAESYADRSGLASPNCEETCFKTEIISVGDLEGCKVYNLKVSHSQACQFALSHFTVGIPCGSISAVTNSENWPIETDVTDPTTGLFGFKIDDIQNFGEEDYAESFTVSFTICPENESCEDQLSCWQPVVAYKAGQCVNYDTLALNCNNLEASAIANDATCLVNGSVTLTVEGGTPPYQFNWSNGATTQNLENITAGAYSVLITDASNNELELTTQVNGPEPMLLETIVTNATCSNTFDGVISLQVTGGVSPFTYYWSNDETTKDIAGLTPGTYNVTVTDAEGCTSTTSATIEQETSIIITEEITNVNCADDNTGVIDISVTGGTEPYNFFWSNGASTEDISGLTSGDYSVIVADNGGCSVFKRFTIESENDLTVKLITTKTGCTDDVSGAIDAIVSGGTGPYTYEWSNGETTEDISGLSEGTYSITVTDETGCSKTVTAAIIKESLWVGFDITNPSCNTVNGAIDISVYNGTGPYTYEWSNGETTEDISGLTAGWYEITVTDASGCSTTRYILLQEISTIQATSNVTNTSCESDPMWSIDISVEGGEEPLTFNWSDGQTTKDIEVFSADTYTVTITDANNCITSHSVLIEETNFPVLACTITAPDVIPVCHSEGNILSASSSDGVLYQWSVSASDNLWEIIGESTNNQITYTAGSEGSKATFTLTITNEQGCTSTCSMTIAACEVVDDPGDGGDDDNPDPIEVDECSNCFSSEFVKLDSSEGCNKYQLKVNQTGSCLHALSHYTVALPCGDLSSVTNSGGWPIELNVLDPTTGLYGFKIDDIEDFGEDGTANSFEIFFTLCTKDDACVNKLSNWSPVVAYKAANCVSYDTLSIEEADIILRKSATDGEELFNSDNYVYAYPNPFNVETTIAIKPVNTGIVTVELYTQMGLKIGTYFSGKAEKGQKLEVKIDGKVLREDTYIYKVSTSDKVNYGRLILYR